MRLSFYCFVSIWYTSPCLATQRLPHKMVLISCVFVVDTLALYRSDLVNRFLLTKRTESWRVYTGASWVIADRSVKLIVEVHTMLLAPAVQWSSVVVAPSVPSLLSQ